MKPVVVYTATACSYCLYAKDLLRRKNIPFEEVLLDRDDEAGWREAERRSGGMKTMPQIFIDGICVGGYTELAALERSGELDRKLE